MKMYVSSILKTGQGKKQQKLEKGKTLTFRHTAIIISVTIATMHDIFLNHSSFKYSVLLFGYIHLYLSHVVIFA